MTRKNTKSVALTAMTALLVLLVIGFGEAFAEILDAGEWQMTTLQLSELSETYAEVITFEGHLDNTIDQNDTLNKEAMTAQKAYLDAFQEVIRFQ